MATRYLALAGNIGVGKSSLVERLANLTGAAAVYEPVGENPYIVDFYKDMPRWGFHSQVYFLTRRSRQHHDLGKATGPVIQDRTIYEDAEVFAKHLHVKGLLDDRDWSTYHELYKTLSAALPRPDVIVYLRAQLPTLKKRIAKRGREFEQAIPDDYLAGLNELYDKWAKGFKGAPVVVIDTDGLDFVTRQGDRDRLIQELSKHGALPA